MRVTIQSIFGMLTSCLILSACSNDKSREVIEQDEQRLPVSEEGLREFKVDEWQSVFGVGLQTETIDASQPNEIELTNDRSIRIPAHSLVDASGFPVDEAKVSFFFVNSVDDAVACGLSTIDSDGRMLVSEGMAFVDAKGSDGKPLRIAKESALMFTMPNNYATSNQGVYFGTTDPDSSIVWEAATHPGEVVISFEAGLLYPDDYWLNVPAEYYDLNDSKYDHTNIATKAVRERLRRTEDLNHYLEWNWNNVAADAATLTINNTYILDIYRNNLDKPIYYSDSLVVDLCRKVLDSCQSGLEDCIHVKDIRTMMGVFEAFYEQKLDRPIDLQPYMKALESNDPVASLEDQGVSQSRAGFLIEVYRRYKANRQAIRDKKQARGLINGFTIKRLGWSNIDKLYTGGIMLYPSIDVEVTGAPENAQFRAILTVEKEKVMVFLNVTNGRVTMNKDRDKYGFDQFDKAILHVWAVASGDVYKGEIPIPLFEDGEYQLMLEPAKE